VESFAQQVTTRPKEGRPAFCSHSPGAFRHTICSRARVIDARIVRAVVVPVADDRLVASPAQLENLVFRVQLVVAVCVDNPLACAIHADVIDTVAVEIADHRDVARLSKDERRVTLGELAVAIEVEIPLPVVEHTDLPNAVAVPIAGQRDVTRLAVMEDVIDQVGPAFAPRGAPQKACTVGGVMFLNFRGALFGKLSASGKPGSREIAHGSRDHAGP
jgi:hypothetical protein